MLCKRRAFSSVCSSQRGEVWKRSPVWGSVPSSSCLWPRSTVQKSTANDLHQEMGIHEGRRRKEPYPLLLRKFSWMYIDVAALLQRIFTADKTMDVDVSHPAGLLKDKYRRTPGQHQYSCAIISYSSPAAKAGPGLSLLPFCCPPDTQRPPWRALPQTWNLDHVTTFWKSPLMLQDLAALLFAHIARDPECTSVNAARLLILTN